MADDWPDQITMARKPPGLPRPVYASEARIDCEYERYVPARSRDDIVAGLRAEVEKLRAPGRIIGERALADRLEHLYKQAGGS